MNAGESPHPVARRESVEARRLAEILARLGGDALLQGLLELLTGGSIRANLSLGVVVDGAVLRGRLASTETAAAELDDRVNEWLQRAELDVQGLGADDTAEVRRRIVAALQGRFTQQARSRAAYEELVRDRLAEIWGEPRGEGYEDRPRVEDLPDDLVSDAVDYLSPRTAFTLADAQMLLASGQWASIGVARVIASHVGTWWLEPDGRAT
ncbi:MAG: hypothetical protein ACLGIA_00635 [Actinomycetes bacterium]